MEKYKKQRTESIYPKAKKMSYKKEEPISSAYPVIDTDLARDNIENDLTSADKQDL